MNIRRILFAIYFTTLTFSSGVYAAGTYSWLPGTYTISEVAYFHGPTGWYHVSVFVNEPISTGCAGDSVRQLTYRNTSIVKHAELILSQLQTASVTGDAVKLHVEDVCVPGSGGNAAELHGIGIVAN